MFSCVALLSSHDVCFQIGSKAMVGKIQNNMLKAPVLSHLSWMITTDLPGTILETCLGTNLKRTLLFTVDSPEGRRDVEIFPTSEKLKPTVGA